MPPRASTTKKMTPPMRHQRDMRPRRDAFRPAFVFLACCFEVLMKARARSSRRAFAKKSCAYRSRARQITGDGR